jgi:Tol biopolymer transport system component
MRPLRLALLALAGAALLASTTAPVFAGKGKPQPPPPTSDKILFAERSKKGWEIWMMGSDGAGLTQITHDGIAWRPDISHTLTMGRVAYKGNPSGGTEQWIRLIDMDGTDQVELYRTTRKNQLLDPPLWSPDDHFVVYVTDLIGDGTVEVIFSRPDGTVAEQWDTGMPDEMSGQPGAFGGVRGWSPDLDNDPNNGYCGLLLFAHYAYPNWDEYAVKVDTSGNVPTFPETDANGQPVLHQIATYYYVSFSPVLVNGKYRMCYSDAGPTGLPDLYALDLDRDQVTGMPIGLPLDTAGGNLGGTLLTNDSLRKMDWENGWAPDGTAIVYGVDMDGDLGTGNDQEIYKVAVPAVPVVQPAVRLTNNRLQDWNPVWWMPPTP